MCHAQAFLWFYSRSGESTNSNRSTTYIADIDLNRTGDWSTLSPLERVFLAQILIQIFLHVTWLYHITPWKHCQRKTRQTTFPPSDSIALWLGHWSRKWEILVLELAHSVALDGWSSPHCYLSTSSDDCKTQNTKTLVWRLGARTRAHSLLPGHCPHP